MQTLPGIAVSPGVAIGEALVIDYGGYRIPRRFAEAGGVDDEIGRWRQANAAAAEELQRNRDQVTEQLGQHYGAIFSAQLQMLGDPHLASKIEELIERRHYSSEFAVSQTLKEYAKVFQDLPNDLIAQRANDVLDIEKRLLGELLGPLREAYLVGDVRQCGFMVGIELVKNKNSKKVKAFKISLLSMNRNSAWDITKRREFC